MSSVAPPSNTRDQLHLSHVAIGVTNLDAVTRFYTDVIGLIPAETLPDGRVRLGWGRGNHALELTTGDGLQHFAFEANASGLEHLEQRMDQHGVAHAWAPGQGEHPAALVCTDPDGWRVEIHGPVDRSGERVERSARRPIRIHHLTLGSIDLARFADFYVEILGLRISDRMGDVFTWMRGDAEHHSIAVVRAEGIGLDHFAFEIGDWDELKRWCDDLAVLDVPLMWGPGRHGPGNNLFVMFDDPAGNKVELSCEMERFWDGRAEYAPVPRRWEPAPRTVNLWGPTPAWRDSNIDPSTGGGA